MKEFEVLCVTMFANDFSLYQAMNVDSDILFANQTDHYAEDVTFIGENRVRMYATNTRGVGSNRNIALLHAEAEICLLSDDDMTFRDNYKEIILDEFKKHPKADVIIFNIGTTTPEYGRIPTVTKRFKRMRPWSRNPYGAPRIAFRLNSVRKKNLVFSTFFGGGCLFSNGEDIIWSTQLMNSGLKLYISPSFIGDVSYERTSWKLDNYKEKFYTMGAIVRASQKRMWLAYILFHVLFSKKCGLARYEIFKLLIDGTKGYDKLMPYKEYIAKKGKRL